jgi:transmembrane sensor
VQIKATGTQFEVNRVYGDQVRIIVSEGSVDVLSQHGGATQIVSLTAGEKAFASSRGITPIQPADVARELAWTDGWLIFERETVGEAIAFFNHLTDVQIVVDPTLNERPVRGRFQTSETDSFAAALAAQTRGRVDRSKPNVLRIRSRVEQR